jgi:hypothetical protein
MYVIALSRGAVPPLPLTLPLKGERCSISKAVLDMSYVAFRVPSKGAILPGSPRRASIGRDAAFTERTLLSHEIPGKRTPLQVPQRGPYGERETHFQSRPLRISRSPVRGESFRFLC